MAERESVPAVDEQWTCGKGLAEQARVPAKMAELLEVLAENLETHVPTIDTGEAFERFVARENELLDLLAASVERDGEMLRHARDAGE